MYSLRVVTGLRVVLYSMRVASVQSESGHWSERINGALVPRLLARVHYSFLLEGHGNNKLGPRNTAHTQLIVNLTFQLDPL